MKAAVNKIAIVCSVAAIFAIMPYSTQISKQTGVTVAANQAQARIGRPLTPMSVAGVARRTTRRHVYGHAAYYAHHPYYRY